MNTKKLLFTIMMLITSFNVMSEENNKWTSEEIYKFSTLCFESLIADARIGYYKRAKEKGDLSPKPFPEDLAKSGILNFCSCAADKASETWTYNDFNKNLIKNAASIIKSSIDSNICNFNFQMTLMKGMK